VFAMGKDVNRLGKIDTAEMSSNDDPLSATRAAAADLHLAAKLDRQKADRTADFSIEDERGPPWA